MLITEYKHGNILPALYGFEKFEEEFNRFFNGHTRDFAKSYPAINVYKKEDGFVIKTEVPGIDPDKLDISVEGDRLTLSGVREESSEAVEGEKFHRRERWHGRFARTLKLPYAVKGEDVEAGFSKGVLTVSIKEPEEHKPRKIEIKTA